MWKRIMAIAMTVTAIAWQGCEKETIEEPVDCNANPVAVQLVSVEDASCNASDGKVTLNATGGNGAYKYALGDGAAQESAVFSNLGAGTYEVTATDGNNCSSTMEVSVKNRDGLNIAVALKDAGGCGAAQGGATITAFDGAEPYEYRLGDGSFVTTNSFAGLSAGEYALTVRDATGCEVNQTLRVLSGVSFTASISPIIKNKCAISGCHNGTQFPDFRVFKNIHDNAGQVKTLTGNGTMPQQGSLTQDEINLIACWVDDGAPEN